MRFALSLLLLLPVLCHAATIVPTACWDGSYATTCPPETTSPTGGADLSDTSSGVSVTTDQAGGTIYAAYKATATPGVCPTEPTRAQIVGGTGGFTTVSATATAGTNQLSLTGLTASTEYCVWFLHVNAVGVPSANSTDIATYIVEADPFETLASAPSGDDLETFNAYFVGTGGVNDAGCGTETTPGARDQHENRCATLAGLPTTMTAGTDVYILAGSDLNPYTASTSDTNNWAINWSGGASDRVIIGCYYRDGSTSTSCDAGAGAGAQTLPIIRGTYAESCRDDGSPSTCPVDSQSAVPSSRYEALVHVDSQAYITIQDLDIRESSGAGITFDENAAGAVASKAIIQRNTITRTLKHAIGVLNARSASNAIIRENTVHLGSLSFVDGRTVPVTDTTWSPCTFVRATNSATVVGALIEDNVTSYCGGESYDALRAGYITIRGNTASNGRRAGLYLDNASNTVVEHNFIVGGGFTHLTGYVEYGSCISLSIESYGVAGAGSTSSVDNVIRNNVCANTNDGIRIFTQADAADNVPALKIGAKIYGNTFALYSTVQNNNIANQFLDITPASDNVDYLEISGNLFAGTAGCILTTYGAKDDLTYNAWESDPTDNDCDGANSSFGATGITLERWYTDNMPTLAELTPSAVGLGDGVAQTETILDQAEYANWSEFSDALCDPSEADWEKEMVVDYDCTARGGTPDAGAIEVP